MILLFKIINSFFVYSRKNEAVNICKNKTIGNEAKVDKIADRKYNSSRSKETWKIMKERNTEWREEMKDWKKYANKKNFT